MEKPSAVLEKLHTHHSKKKAYECGKLSIQMSRLRRPHGRHAGEKPCAYEEWGKAFSNKSHLTDHGKMPTGKNLLNEMNGKASLARSNTSLKIKMFILG